MPIATTLQSTLPGGSLRATQSPVAKDGFGIVYDRDIITTWRLPSALAAYEIYFWEKAFEWALGAEAIRVAIESLADDHDLDHHSGSALLHLFGDYVGDLGTQIITINIAGLVEDMMQTYEELTQGNLRPFAWQQDLSNCIEDFIYSRECFIFSELRAPAVEATFSVPRFRPDELDINLDFSWKPPVVDFDRLQNLIYEGQPLTLKPSFVSRPHTSHLPRLEEYVVGPGDDWLRWDDASRCFHGIVPAHIASKIGMQRSDVYTIALELTATVTKLFPADVRLERIIRCALPLTVKRRPELCRRPADLLRSPPSAHACTDAEEPDWFLERFADDPPRKCPRSMHRVARKTSVF